MEEEKGEEGGMLSKANELLFKNKKWQFKIKSQDGVRMVH
jgi:hypothetical protein